MVGGGLMSDGSGFMVRCVKEVVARRGNLLGVGVRGEVGGGDEMRRLSADGRGGMMMGGGFF